MNENKIKLKYLCESFNSAIIASTLKTRGKTAVYGASGLSGYSDNEGISTEYLGIVKDGAGVGRVAQYKAGTLLVGTMSYIFPKKDCDINWLKYCIASLNLADSIDKATIPHIYFSDYGNRSVLNLSREKQKKTADFLEGKTSLVDQLISNQEKQVERLKEYRQAIITKVVTKGLDPSVQMKDSGVEWIGKIPCTWQVKRIKDFLEKDDFGIKCGPFGSALTGKVISNGEYNIYGQWNVIGNDFSIRRNTIAKNDYLNLINYSVRPKDILVSMMGSIGRCALVPENIHPGIMDSHIIKIRLNLNEMNPYFFLYEYDKNNSTIISEFYNRAKKGFIMDGLNTSIIKNAIFVSPPIDIQKKVVDYLDSFCSKVDAVISFKESKIQKLQTYKKSLIYEYVTGKKRVSL